MKDRPKVPEEAAQNSEQPPWIRQHAEGITVAIAAQPSAKRSEIVGVQGRALKIKIAAPPFEGLATEALCDFLAAKIGVKRRDVEIMQGATSRQKVVLVRGVSLATVLKALTP